jgi:vancomycin permeability regulator SanA
MSPRAKRALILSSFAVFGAAAIAVCNAVVTADAASRTTEVASAERADCILVLGAGVWATGPSPVLEDRLETALALYRAGKAPRILVSGDHGRPEYDEPGAMAAWLEARGVPAEHVFLDHAGFDTHSTMVRAREVFGVERAIVVTQRFHLARAVPRQRRRHGGPRRGRRSPPLRARALVRRARDRVARARGRRRRDRAPPAVPRADVRPVGGRPRDAELTAARGSTSLAPPRCATLEA